MNLLYGTSLASCLGALMIVVGYAVAGFLSSEDRLLRLTVASLVGLAWVVFAASVIGAFAPLGPPVAWAIWTPALFTLFNRVTRNHLLEDLRGLLNSKLFVGAACGFILLWLAILLPFAIYPDLVFFDGRANHDNFFWAIGAEYLQQHNYLSAPTPSAAYPLYNVVDAIIGWRPGWGRMGSEGFLAVLSSTLRMPSLEIYNFLVASLALPWLLTTLSLACRMGLRSLNRQTLAAFCFCQPILFFFISNGNLPNLFGAIFGGGLWLLTLLVFERRFRLWPLFVTGLLFIHALLGCYPEILPFALAPIALLSLRNLFRAKPGRGKPVLIILFIVGLGLCLNPLTTARAVNGFLNSINQVQQDSGWANVFAQLTPGGYIPAFTTLSMPSTRVYGLMGGLIASGCVIYSLCSTIKQSRRRDLVLISLSGFALMLAYTFASSFGYGWQKSVQFYGVTMAVLFPALLLGNIQERFQTQRGVSFKKFVLLATLALLGHGMLGSTAESLKSAGYKGLTRPMLALGEEVSRKYAGQPIYIDGATFRASFFHSMWAARLFPHNPLIFLSREEQAGGYLSESVTQETLTAPIQAGLHFVATNWADSFDYQPAKIYGDRVAVLLKQHNLVTECQGFFRATGVPVMAGEDFSLTLHPYADGWIEFTLTPNGHAAADCRAEGQVTSDGAVSHVNVPLGNQPELVLRFPLKAGTANAISVHVHGSPPVDLESDDPPFPFRVLQVKTIRR